MFHTFPGGWAGVGLLLLRASIGMLWFSQGWISVAHGNTSKLTADWSGSIAIAGGALLLAGYLTPLASGTAALVGVAITCSSIPSPSLFDSKLASALATVVAVSLTCIGPGAFSIDARLFGRREIFISGAPRSTQR